ncbi:M48 family metallopeptidase [Flavisolibacter nicotianae]|uniref:M48 family metallopeptidase n=1 Tax=Flavisolibacter nicotianae TaxID=2364882 RepID=UPI000EAC38BB|nr:M48 family metallopeptidase [Flavisolibacter nicotianae]
MNPPLPKTHPDALLAPSAQFKKEAAKSVMAILAFLLVYLLLFLISLALVGLCFYAGYFIIVARASLYTLLFSVGLVGCGIMVFVFLVKFLFATTRADESDCIEITKDDQPLLFQTIYDLARETGTARPKKVFLSDDVNAAVFYNSSFLSLFFPVRKNLKIGLGLVNSLNVSELKAVLAHEFGHFSQRSMKVGSWVYQVNKVIYDMLFNNQGYANSLRSFASVHGLVAICVQLTVKAVQGIQWVLHQMFKVVNSSYLSLSRQMEFHADLVAASVCGSNNIIHALRRSEFANDCFAATLETCNTAWKEKQTVTDFYAHHRFVLGQMAAVRQVKLLQGLPVLDIETESRVGCRVNYKDQWASHPTLQERKAYLDSFALTATVDEAPAWTLFENAADWKERVTKQFYKSIPPEEIKGQIDALRFAQLFEARLQTVAFPPVFKNFYANRSLADFDPEAVSQQPYVLQAFDDLLTDEALLLPQKLAFLEQDLAVLQALSRKEIAVRSFDFDGRKYRRQEAATILAQLEGEREILQNQLEALDQRIFRHFYAIAPLAEAEVLKSLYKNYFACRNQADESLSAFSALLELLGPVFRGETLAINAIREIIASLKKEHEPGFKQSLHEWIAAGAFDHDPTVKSAAEKFIQSRYAYFSGEAFFDNELIELNRVVQGGWACIHHYLFSLFKTITETQAGFLHAKAHDVQNA